ncbi:MAG: SH3 domain-containing protein [Endomicrobiaceae bacterium]
MKIFKVIVSCIIIFLSLNANQCKVFANENVFSEKFYDLPEGPDFLTIAYSGDQDITIPNGPTFLNSISRDMKSPGYWVAKIKNPDKIILSYNKILSVNNKILSHGILLNDVINYPNSVRKSILKNQINTILRLFTWRKYLDSSLKTINQSFIKKIKKNIKIPSSGKYVKVKFAMTVKYSNVRLLPTDTAFLYNKETSDIDRLQVAGLDLGEPLAVLTVTKDKKWAYIISLISEGWIKTKDIAFTDRTTLTKWSNAKSFVVIINPKADIFIDRQMKKYHDYVRMASKLPLIKKFKNQTVCIRIPASDKKRNLFFTKGYMNASDINYGFLKYTQRNVLYQAFKHLNSPYGWGGAYGEQDCSTFIRQLFGCFGFTLPRNSSNQKKCGVSPVAVNINDSDYTKTKKLLNHAVNGISLLYLPGHIMVYIGSEKGTPYVIHSIWGTENWGKNGKTINFINRIVVSNLLIGDGTKKGSLLKRLSRITIIK